MKSSDDYVTVSRQLIRDAHKLIYHLAGKLPPKKISMDESLEMASVLMELQLNMTKRSDR
jgi:hypothetical protein